MENNMDLVDNLKCCFCQKVYINNTSFEKHKLLCQIKHDKYDEEKNRYKKFNTFSLLFN